MAKVKMSMIDTGVTEETALGYAAEVEVEEGTDSWDIVQDYLKGKTLRRLRSWVLIYYRRPGATSLFLASGSEKAAKGDRIIIMTTHVDA